MGNCCLSANGAYEDLQSPLLDEDHEMKAKILLKILDSKLTKGGFVQYRIQVCDAKGRALWEVYRRYGEFHSLLAAMKSRIPSRRLPSLPPKKTFGNTTEAVVSERKTKFQEAVDILVRDPLVMQDSDFRKFLRDDKQNVTPGKGDFNPLMDVSDFKLLRVIGQGSYAKVMQVQNKQNGKIYAMKILRKHHLVARGVSDNAMTERQILADLNHPFICRLHYSFQTHNKLYLIVDYFQGGELYFHLKKERSFSLQRTRLYAAQVILAVQHLHDNGVIYRDLKPENILLDSEGYLRVSDFGLSKRFIQGEDDSTKTFCGTPSYASPEMLKRTEYNRMVDWWSVGILIFEMLTGRPPFRHRNARTMFRMIVAGNPDLSEIRDPPAADLIRKLLASDPNKRLGVGGINEITRHPFFASINWKKVYNKQYAPEFIPVKDPMNMTDVTNVDPKHIKRPATNTPVEDSSIHSKLAFPGFSYNCEKVLSPSAFGQTDSGWGVAAHPPSSPHSVSFGISHHQSVSSPLGPLAAQGPPPANSSRVPSSNHSVSSPISSTSSRAANTGNIASNQTSVYAHPEDRAFSVSDEDLLAAPADPYA